MKSPETKFAGTTGPDIAEDLYTLDMNEKEERERELKDRMEKEREKYNLNPKIVKSIDHLKKTLERIKNKGLDLNKINSDNIKEMLPGGDTLEFIKPASRVIAEHGDVPNFWERLEFIDDTDELRDLAEKVHAYNLSQEEVVGVSLEDMGEIIEDEDERKVA